MSITQLLNELAQQNIRLTVDGDQLAVRAPRGVMTPWLHASLTEHKAEILELLGRNGSVDGPARFPAITPAPGDKHLPFPLTDIQQAYWVGRMSEFDQGDVSIHFYTELDGDDLDVGRLESAWRRMVERHDMLRCVILPDGSQQILQHVAPFTFPVTDLRAADAAAVDAMLAEVREQLSHQVLRNDQWPAFDIRASLLPDGRTRLHVSIDLVNIDGGSVMLLMDEWTRTYFDPAVRLEPIELSYRDYVLAERSLTATRSYQESLEYWRNRVTTLPSAPDLPFATDAGKPARTRFVHKTATIDRETWERLKSRASAHDVTVSAVLATAYADTLASWAKEPDFTLNVTLFNRLPLHPQVDSLLGDFTSMILLGVDGSAGGSFAARARTVQTQLWNDLEHHQVSGIQVLREFSRSRGHYSGAVMPIVFTNMLNLSAKGFAPLYTALERLGEIAFIVTQTPQVWLDYQVHEDTNGLRLTWDAVEKIFPPGMVDEMLTAHCGLLRGLADTDDAWTRPWRRYTPPGQLAQRATVNATEGPVPDDLLHTLFVDQASRRPEQTAVVATGRTLTYAELLRHSSHLSGRLRSLGAAPNTLVAVLMAKGWEQVVAVLGIHMSGAAYLPLDPDWPAERIACLIEHGEVGLVVTQSHVDDRLTLPPGVLRVVVDPDPVGDVRDDQLVPVQKPTDLAYVLYTSGSTGTPKGVMIEHRSVVNRMLDVNERAAIGPGDRCMALTALHHDLSVYDIFGVLAAGATVLVPDAADLREPARWAQLLRQENVTVWNSVPAFLEMLVEHLEHVPARELPRTLRFVILAGDWIPVTLPDRLRRLVPVPQIAASGGPTETTIWDIWYSVETVDPAWRSIPYGKPMTNTRYHVLDAALQPCPVWVSGELYIGGEGLARGYWRDEERTRAAFVVHPVTGERLYRSGDLGCYRPDGNIEFLGRADNQVKIGGVRIEPEEVEITLGRHPGVRRCAVIAQDGRLVAFVVSEEDTGASAPSQLLPVEGTDEALADSAARLEFKARRLDLRADLETRPAVALPAVDDGQPVLGAFENRRSRRTFASEPVTMAVLGQLLAAMRESAAGSRPRRNYPSAGSLYPVQLYVYVHPGRVAGVEAGTYYYHPADHRLVLVSPDARIDATVHAPVNRGPFESAAFSIFLVGRMAAIEPLYGVLARDFCLLEAGYMGQVLTTSAPEVGLDLCPLGGVVSAAVVHEALALEQSDEVVHILLGGGAMAGADKDDANPGALTSAALRGYLRTKLPEAMVPALYHSVATLPLTTNGKIDRRALAAHRVAAPEVSARPASGLEQQVAAVVCDVLDVRQIEPGDNFFEVGATSVHLVRIAGRLRADLGMRVAVTELFRTPNVRALSVHLAGSQSHSTEPAAQVRSRVETRLAARGRRRERGQADD